MHLHDALALLINVINVFGLGATVLARMCSAAIAIIAVVVVVDIDYDLNCASTILCGIRQSRGSG